MKRILKKINWKTLFLNEEKVKELAKGTNMFNTMRVAEKVFIVPEIVVTVKKYDGPKPTIDILGKTIKLPRFFAFEENSNDIEFNWRLSEIYVRRMPKATFTRLGKTWECSFEFTPINDTSNKKNYWTSVIEYTHGRGVHKGSLSKTIQYLGKESLGLPFDGEDWDTVNNGFKGNSLYFVVDKSYVRPDYYSMYEFACKEYNKNESPLMI